LARARALATAATASVGSLPKEEVSGAGGGAAPLLWRVGEEARPPGTGMAVAAVARRWDARKAATRPWGWARA